jgi:hypothetical protein
VLSDNSLLVTQGCRLVSLDRETGAETTVLDNIAQELHGVAVGPLPLHVVVVSATGAVFKVALLPEGACAERIVGADHPATREMEEGTANMCALAQPLNCCFIGKGLLLTDVSHRCIRMLSDAYVLATELMPVVHGMFEAFGFYGPTTMAELEQRVSRANKFFSIVVADNKLRTGREKDAQGQCGNPSLVARKALKNLEVSVARARQIMAQLGVPPEVIGRFSAGAITTLHVEVFFPGMRSKFTNPSALEFCRERTNNIEELSKRCLVSGPFSFHTGPSHLYVSEETDNGHTATPVDIPPATLFSIQKRPEGRLRDSSTKTERERHETVQASMKIIYQAAKICGSKLRTRRVTDNGKAPQGAVPLAFAFAPASFLHTSAVTSDSARNSGAATAVEATSRVVYRMHALVFVKAARGTAEVVFFAQLLEHIVEVTEQLGLRRRHPFFANPTPSVRFFSPTADRGHYTYDPDTFDTVSVGAIHGAVRSFNNLEVDRDGLLQRFSVSSDELDQMEGVVGEMNEDNDDDNDDNNDEADSEALAQHQERERQQQAMTDDPALLVLPAQRGPNGVEARFSLRDRRPAANYYSSFRAVEAGFGTMEQFGLGGLDRS